MVQKALIFNPYLDTLGGGEFYTLCLVQFLLGKNFSVEIAWPEKAILSEILKRFNLNFAANVKFNKKAYVILKQKGNLLPKYRFTKNYDLIIYVSDGSIPWLFGKKNWLHFQVPFINVKGPSLMNQFKLRNIEKIICNSNYVKKYIDKEFRVKAEVIYPPLGDEFRFKKLIKKQNIILAVGRFDEILNSKKQDILIRAFRKIVDEGLKDWQLILIGGLLKSKPSFNNLKKSAYGYPIKILTNAGFNTLLKYYQKAKIYWHAAGFGSDLSRFPHKAEHFGISVVEAMACGAVPLVFNGGGPVEIIKESELKWISVEELIIKTKKLIEKERFWAVYSKKMWQQALRFQIKYFDKRLSSLLE